MVTGFAEDSDQSRYSGSEPCGGDDPNREEQQNEPAANTCRSAARREFVVGDDTYRVGHFIVLSGLIARDNFRNGTRDSEWAEDIGQPGEGQSPVGGGGVVLAVGCQSAVGGGEFCGKSGPAVTAIPSMVLLV